MLTPNKEQPTLNTQPKEMNPPTITEIQEDPLKEN